MQAREIMEKEVISLILCDIEMPGESGLEFISSVREKADLDDENIEALFLPVIQITNLCEKRCRSGVVII